MTPSDSVTLPAVAAACMILMGAPFAFRLIPRNPVFGFKISWTLADDDIWFAVNARVGRDFLALGSLLGLHAYLLWKGIYALPRGNLTVLLGILGGLAVILARGFALARRMARDKNLPWEVPGGRHDG